jgi:ATP/maltotriose-dependent transcriptional regulator MalT
VLIELTSLEALTRARYTEAADFGERALKIAGEIGDVRLQAHAALAMAGVQIRAVSPSAGRPLLRQALDLALAIADPLLAAEACGSLSNVCYWTGELRQARDYAQRRLELAEQAGDVFGMRHAHSWLAIVLLTLGEFGSARELLDRCAPLLERLDNPEPIAVVRMFSAVIALQLGEFERSRALAAEAIELLERVDAATVVWYRPIVVLACLGLGRNEEAERQLRNIEATLGTLPESALPARSARTAIGIAYAQLGDRPRAAACERALRPYADDHHWWLTRRTLATLAALRGDTTLALADLALAEVQARHEDLLPDLAVILLQRAELQGLAQPDGQSALREARGLLSRLGMRAVLTRADSLLGAAFAAPAAPAGLTRRELEVLRHVAHGSTNREIAEALSISEHTVVNHLSHIFGKIGADNRTTAAAYALRQGIA